MVELENTNFSAPFFNSFHLKTFKKEDCLPSTHSMGSQARLFVKAMGILLHIPFYSIIRTIVPFKMSILTLKINSFCSKLNFRCVRFWVEDGEVVIVHTQPSASMGILESDCLTAVCM